MSFDFFLKKKLKMEESKRMKTVCNVTVDLKKGKNKEAIV